MDHQWNQQNNCILDCDWLLGIARLYRKFQDTDPDIYWIYMPYFENILNWQHIQVCKKVVCLYNLVDMSILHDHLQLYICCKDRKVKAHKELF